MKENVQLFDLSSVELTKSVSMMENLKEEMNIVIRDIEEEDEVRGHYSLSKSKASDVKLPRFGGKPHENFAKFKTEMFKGFKSNKVRKEDQVKKLRENLFDQPKQWYRMLWSQLQMLGKFLMICMETLPES